MSDLAALVVSPSAWAALAALVAMELVLGVDNLVFLALVSARVTPERRGFARATGLAVALALRLLLLGALAKLVGLTEPLFEFAGWSFSLRDLVLLGGGFFLIGKATQEIHEHVEGADEEAKKEPSRLSFGAAISQIVALDIVFSIDSIVTAVGMTDHFPIMAVAVVVVVIAMGFAAGPLTRVITSNPTWTMLALGFLLAIGLMLIADGFHVHVPKGYLYAAFLFSILIEALNTLRRRKRRRRNAS